MNPFRDLDDRFLPTLARWADRVIPKPPPPTGPLPVILRLRAVDDRWTGSGPLALLREVPQLGAVAIAALVLASGITVASRSHPASRAAEPAATEDVCGVSSGRLGPQLGDSVPAYVDAARARLQRAASCQPDGVAVGVVSFSRYVTVAKAQELVGPSAIRKVFYRVPLPLGQTDWRSVGVGSDAPADLYKEWERIARNQLAEANELLKVAATITNDPAQKKQNETDAAIYQREAAQLRAHCACVFAVVVESKLRVLDALGSIPGVRAVDAGRGRLEAFEFSALMPEETVTATGGNQAP